MSAEAGACPLCTPPRACVCACIHAGALDRARSCHIKRVRVLRCAQGVCVYSSCMKHPRPGMAGTTQWCIRTCAWSSCTRARSSSAYEHHASTQCLRAPCEHTVPTSTMQAHSAYEHHASTQCLRAPSKHTVPTSTMQAHSAYKHHASTQCLQAPCKHTVPSHQMLSCPGQSNEGSTLTVVAPSQLM